MNTKFGFGSKLLIPILALAALAPTAAMADPHWDGGDHGGYRADYHGHDHVFRGAYEGRAWAPGYDRHGGYWYGGRWIPYYPAYQAGVTIVVPEGGPACGPAYGPNYGPAPYYYNGAELQDQKNTERSIAIGAGAVGVIGLINHNPTESVLGLLGAAVAGSAYEHDRHVQSQIQNGPGYQNNGNQYNNAPNGSYHDGE